MKRIFDLHCDTLYRMYKENLTFDSMELAVNSSDIAEYDNYIQVFAIWTHDGNDKPKKDYDAILANAKMQLDFCKNENITKNKMTALLSIENGTVISDIKDVESFYNDGVRSIALTWNGKNRLAGGAAANGGLTEFGRDVVLEMNRLGIAADMSHLNEESFFDTAEAAKYILASHSCCNAVYNHRRNLSDEQLLKIKEKNGIVGLCFYPAFLGPLNVFDALLKNAEHLLSLGMEDNISVGSDFDGAEMSEQLYNCSHTTYIYNCFLTHFKDKELVDKIFFANAYEFYNNLLTKGR